LITPEIMVKRPRGAALFSLAASLVAASCARDPAPPPGPSSEPAVPSAQASPAASAPPSSGGPAAPSSASAQIAPPSADIFTDPIDTSPGADPLACAEPTRAGRPLPAQASPKIQKLSAACEGGERGACVILGAHLERGHGAPTDSLAAANLFWKACKGGDLDGCARLAALSFAGIGAPFHPVCGERVLEASCGKGGALACAELGRRRAQGVLVPFDREGGMALLTKACDLGSTAGCKALIEAGGASEAVYARYEKAAEAECDRGLGEACRVLVEAHHPTPYRPESPPFGRAWREGKDRVSWARAHELAKKACLSPLDLNFGCTRLEPAKENEILLAACDAGDFERCIDLGFKGSQGESAAAPSASARPAGSGPRQPTAADRFRIACLGGVSRGCWAMASKSKASDEARKIACSEGELEACHPTFVERSERFVDRAWSNEARAFACEHGSAMDCRAIAEELISSKRAGAEAEILKLLEKACPAFPTRRDVRDLDARACELLGRRYRLGEGGARRDPVRAARLFRAACFAEGRYNQRGLGCAELADMFDKGEGIPRDPDRATDLLAGLCFADRSACAAYKARAKVGESEP
jgi:TPR repeat protein